jgi:hypothetical protein
MRHFLILALAVQMGLSGGGCATVPLGATQDPVRSVADSGCRNLASFNGKVQSYCGTPAQWAELDSRMAQLGQGFSCRPVKGSQPLCQFAKQWEYTDRMTFMGRMRQMQSSGYGDGASRSAAEISHNDPTTIRQDLSNAAGGRPLSIP